MENAEVILVYLENKFTWKVLGFTIMKKALLSLSLFSVYKHIKYWLIKQKL